MFCRVRPFNEIEVRLNKELSIDIIDEKSLKLVTLTDFDNNKKSDKQIFTFDYIFKMNDK